MTRLLVAGVGPRPSGAERRVFAPGLRLQTFLHVLCAAGHDVALCEASFSGTQPGAADPPEGVSFHRTIGVEPDVAERQLAVAAREFRPDAIVALTDGVALGAAQCGFDGPLYVDYNGHPMAERQMAGTVHGNDASLLRQWLFVLPVLVRADMFATCSAAQRLALIGELGAAGRINSLTCGSDLVHVLRPPNPFDTEFPARAPFLRGVRVPADARIILFTGGYNTWLDEETLFAGVERVLARDPRAVYVSTGGAIDGHVTAVFERFRTRVEKSPLRDRFVFVGWLDHEQYEQCCLEADVGVICDLPTLEAELGCRNRLYGWLWGGMRAVATALPEIVRTELGPLGLVDGVPPSDAGAFAEAVARCLEQGRPDGDGARERRRVLTDQCSPESYYGPLADWARAPERAADRPEGAGAPANELARFQASFVAHMGRQQPLRELVSRLRGSRAARLWLAGHPEVEELLASIEKTIR